MEVLAHVDLSERQMRKVVDACNGCLIWGGHVNLSPADDILISVERPLRVDTVEQMVASILSKKLAAGSTHLLLDIPVGPSAKIRTNTEAVRVRKLFEHIARQIGLTLNALITRADQPIGRGVGPVLEVRDVMAVLEGRPDAPMDLRDKALLLAGSLLEFDPALPGGAGLARARELLDSGAALKSMHAMIAAQGSQNGRFGLGRYMKDVCAGHKGTIGAIHCQRINRIARLAGAPMDKGAGLDLFKRLGDRVETGEPLYRIYSCVPFNFDFALAAAAENSGFSVDPA
jgi:thymidine phosphorylase